MMNRADVNFQAWCIKAKIDKLNIDISNLDTNSTIKRFYVMKWEVYVCIEISGEYWDRELKSVGTIENSIKNPFYHSFLQTRVCSALNFYLSLFSTVGYYPFHCLSLFYSFQFSNTIEIRVFALAFNFKYSTIVTSNLWIPNNTNYDEVRCLNFKLI